jgi:hypothetical protein
MSAVWHLDGKVARLDEAAIQTTIDVAAPSGGLVINLHGVSRSPLVKILGVAFLDDAVSDSNIDAYIRGSDLVATYEESPVRPIRAQVYWRRLAPEAFATQDSRQVGAAFELIVSANTSRLDSDPRARVVSAVDLESNVSWLPLGSADIQLEESHPHNLGCWLAKLPGCELSLLQMIHPLDAGESFATAGKAPLPQQQISHRLFQVRLEKGVILRARVRAALVASGSAVAVAKTAYQHFAAAEPPLTV